LKAIEIRVAHEPLGKHRQTHHPVIECTRYFRVEKTEKKIHRDPPSAPANRYLSHADPIDAKMVVNFCD
jgi:hypothetical protein